MMKKTSPKNKLLKEKLLSKLLWGWATTLLGRVHWYKVLWLGYVGNTDPWTPMTSSCFGFILLAIGIPFLINYSLGKKMLAKELEAEEKVLIAHTSRELRDTRSIHSPCGTANTEALREASARPLLAATRMTPTTWHRMRW